MRHAFENNYFSVVLCNLGRTFIGKIKCSNDNVSLQLIILTSERCHFWPVYDRVTHVVEKKREIAKQL